MARNKKKNGCTEQTVQYTLGPQCFFYIIFIIIILKYDFLYSKVNGIYNL